jgi:hypothetical protein
LSAQVIPFRRQDASPQEAIAFAIGARVDLRIGALASGIVRPRGAVEDTFSFSALARLLRAARMTWKERGANAPLTLQVPSEIYADLEAELLSEAAIEAGCTRQNLSFEICERAIVDKGVALAEALRQSGWGVTLRGDPECPLPFGARARALYTEIVLQAPDKLDAYAGLGGADRSPLTQRLLAARAAGLLLTAETVRTPAQAKALALAGFDRGGGPFAEAGLRGI